MVNEVKRIPVSSPSLTKLERTYVLDALKTGFISGTGGKYLKEFEEGFAKLCGVSYGVACSNGTNALHLALVTAGIKKGDEVIVPAFTNIATALAVIYCGATPVLVDSRKDTWCMDETKIEEKITPRTKAIIPVHIYGHAVKMDTVMEIAKKHKLIVIEDAAEGHGASFKDRKLGSIGEMGCFSFYANKIVTTGEGGMVVTNNKEYAARLKSLGSLAYGNVNRYEHVEVGFNYRMTNIQAALGVAQLQRIDELVAKKREIASWYNKGLSKIKGLQLPCEMPWAKNVYWMYGVVVNEKLGMTRDELTTALAANGIETRSFFYPMHLQPALQNLGLFKGESYPVSEWLFNNGLYLPCGTPLKKKDISYVCNTFKEIAKR